MAYSGKFQPQNPQKYEGNPDGIFFRSSWELSAFKWLDGNPDVVSWSSEECVIPYILPEDEKVHRYFPDLKITWASGKTFIVEIKPEKETIPPKVTKKKNQIRLMEEISTFSKNSAKWEAASKWCAQRGYIFNVWTEKSLEQLGIKTGVMKSKMPKRRIR